MTKLVRDVIRMENDLVSELISSRKAQINRLKEWRPEGSIAAAIDLIFYKSNTKGINGKAIKELVLPISS
jgi:hypothetical protein